jgi:uncharacterized protein (TIGR02646 family)
MSGEFEKGNTAPGEFRAWLRKNPRASSWKELSSEAKEALRTQLHRDQQGFCCYCYVRLGNSSIDHIDHVEPQNDGNRFDWDNLALACEGGNKSGRPSHCDHAKGEKRLSAVHPYRNPVSRLARLKLSGVMEAQEAPGAAADIDEILCLNQPHLKDARRNALKAIMRDLDSPVGDQQHWSARRLEAALADLPPRSNYAPLVRGWLERQLSNRA